MRQPLLSVLAACVYTTHGFTPVAFSRAQHRGPRASLLPSHAAVTAEGIHIAQQPASSDIEGWFNAREAKDTSHLQVSKARSMPEVLVAFWDFVAGEVAADETVLLFPDCKQLAEIGAVERLTNHLEICRDNCERFGTELLTFPIDPAAPAGHPNNGPFPGLLIKNIGAQKEFADDDFWDDDWDLDPALLARLREDDDIGGLTSAQRDALSHVPDDDQELLDLTQSWVSAMIADMGVCPFTTSSTKAGLPLGDIHYPVCRDEKAEEVYAAYWREVVLIERTDERKLSTTLMLTPKFGLENVEGFMGFTDTLAAPLTSLGLETTLQLVFFHPEWVFRDGTNRAGDAAAANFARRSPFPMINILRTPQVRIAQKAIPTGLVYTQNEETLEKVGADELQAMLVQRDWTSLKDQKVDRRSNELFDKARQLVDEYAASTSSVATTAATAVAEPLAAAPETDLESMDLNAMLEVMGKLDQGE